MVMPCAPSDAMPRFPVHYHVYADEVLKHYGSDKNQAIHCMISCQPKCQMKLELRHLTIRVYQQLEQQTILVGSACRKLIPHPTGYLA